MPSSLGQKPAASQPKAGTGWQNAVPLDVPGVKYVDQLCDHFAALDKAERVKEALELAAISKRSEKMK
jgi:hypothetical protein